MNPLAVSRQIEQAYTSYLRSTFAPRNADWRAQFERGIAERLTLAKGPYLQATPPFTPGASLADLITEGVLSPGFYRIPDAVFPLDRPLHHHQEIAIRNILNGRNTIVATGTGSGKTEVVLFPTLELLLREDAAGTLRSPGVRTLLLYPMNALANDQLRRLRLLLEAFPEITFGRYVGDTRPKAKAAREVFSAVFPGQTPLRNELLSREEMRERPPHLLLTNFSMLEYLLLRPEDTPFFDGPTGRHWRIVALDEAHVYDGADGTEIALLLRRLRDRITHSERGRLTCIATSATLGRGVADYPTLAEFGTALFDEPFEYEPGDRTRQDIVGPDRQVLARGSAAYELPTDAYELLLEVRAGGVTAIARALGPVCPEAVAQLDGASEVPQALSRVLASDARVIRLQQALETRAMTLTEAADRVFGDSAATQPLVALVDLCVDARETPADNPLLPARYHYWLRGLEGAFVCLHPRHPDGAARLHLAAAERCQACAAIGVSSVLFELGTCRRCRAEYVIGLRDRVGRVRRAPVGVPPTAYLLLDASSAASDDDEASGSDDSEADSIAAGFLCPGCGRLTDSADVPCSCTDQVRRQPVATVTLTDENLILRRCSACSAASTGGQVVGRFLTDASAPAAVVATVLYQELPTAADPVVAAHLGGGRKLLAFADSRQEAAFFAPYLERTYDAALRRSLILRAVEARFEGSPLRLREIEGWLTDEARSKLVLEPSRSPGERLDAVRRWIMQELLALDRRQSLEGVGLVRVSVSGPDTPPAALAPLRLDDADGCALTCLLLDTLRASGVLSFPAGLSHDDPAFAPRAGDYVMRGTGAASRQQVLAWVPARGSNRRRDLLDKIASRCGIQIDAAQMLTLLWDELTNPRSPWSDLLPEAFDSRRGTYRRLNHERIELTPASGCGPAYRCSACGQLWWSSVLDVCPTFRCQGTLVPVPPDEPRNHYAELYRRLAPIVMRVQEHTAQWALERGTAIQRQFLEGELNVLSCSTTFELGVDVGDVEAVLLRNVPPSPANYTQRAGRAGRRAGAAAMVVTLAQRRNHDLAWFRDPTRMIEGSVPPPRVVLDNPVIGRRHAHSVALAAWLRREPQARSVGDFVDPDASGVSGDARWLKWLGEHPDELQAALSRILPEPVAAAIDVPGWSWVEALGEGTPEDPASGWLGRAVTDARDDLAHLRVAIDQASAARNFKLAYGLQRQESTITDEALINFLARRNVLPKYGFPVDVVILDLSRTGLEAAEGIELDRDLRLAIAEYAPGSEVVAAKRVWRSVGLKRHPERDWRTRDWGVCDTCGRYRDGPPDGLSASCPICGSEGFERFKRGRWIAPIFGFVGTSSETDIGESPILHQRSMESWFGEYSKGGEPTPRTPTGIVAGTASTLLSRQGRIVVMNAGPSRRGFRICERCGWGEPSPLRPARGKAASKGHHNPHSHGECDHIPSLRQLGHDFLTDVLEIRIGGNHAPAALRSALYALLEGAGRLGIKRDEIDGALHTWTRTEVPSLVIYDAVPGGAGHARRIEERFAEVVDEAIWRVSSCECAPETSCYGCLRSYSNQAWHEDLSRGAAAAVLGPLRAG